MKVLRKRIHGTICTITGCSKPHKSRGLCSMHDSRFSRHGDPLFTHRAEPGTPLNWLREAIKNPPEGCLIWPFGTGTTGYGVVSYEGATRTAHRVALSLYTGRDVEGEDAAHGPCHNRLCVNPLHLKWATRLENAKDMRRDDTVLTGDKNPSMKIPSSDFAMIMKSGSASCDHAYVQSLAVKYGVSTDYIYRIINKKAKRCREFVK